VVRVKKKRDEPGDITGRSLRRSCARGVTDLLEGKKVRDSKEIGSHLAGARSANARRLSERSPRAKDTKEGKKRGESLKARDQGRRGWERFFLEDGVNKPLKDSINGTQKAASPPIKT